MSRINVVSEDRLTMFEDLKRRFVDEDNFIDLQICNLTRVHSWLVGSDAGLGIAQVELNLLKPGWLKEPYETVYGLLTLQELANLYEQYGKKLVVANIRGYKGTTDVNDKILETIESEPEHFFYLNNGLTAYCDRLEVNNLDRANADFKRVTAYGLSIVNGAQTLGSIAEFFKKNPEAMPEGNVFIKIISLRNCSDDQEFAANITRSTNFQNRINAQDFVSLDEQQERIANQLVLSGIFYHYKDEADLPDPDESNFTMREAITALACLVKRPDCDDFCARILANRASLWSMQGDTENSSIYERIFRADRSARTVWRAVQTQRLVLQVMKDNGRAETGVRKAFFENARWVLLHVVFIKCQSAQGDLLALTELEVSNIRRCAVELAERLWTVCEDQGYVSRGSESQVRHFRSVFSSAVDCEQLRRGLLQALKNT
jgi:AIPR protein